MRALEPYRTERQVVENSSMLDANEHYKQWVKIPDSVLRNLNRYPDSLAGALREKLADCYCGAGVGAEEILVTSGSIEAIDVLINAYKPSRLVLNTPSYDLYRLRANAHGCPCELVPLDSSSQPRVNEIVQKTDRDSMTVLINPNNPTGMLIDISCIRDVLRSARGMVVVDEAYIEFSGLQKSVQSLVKEYANLIILRTFSKAWGLAGIRLGYILSDRRNIEFLTPYRNAYSVNAMGIAIGLHALDQQSELKRQVDNIIECRANLVRKFEQVGLTVQETQANFILLDIPNAHAVHRTLRQKRILVRPRPLLGNLKQGLRITVGSPSENEVMFRAVTGALS